MSRMLRGSRIARAAIAGLLLILAGMVKSVGAASLGISPVVLTLPSGGQSAVVRLKNQASERILVQIMAVEWREPGEIDTAPPAPEIVVAPPVVMLEPSGRQVIRVALRQPLESRTEQAYRLLVTEVPLGINPNQNGLSFSMRMDLPLFVTPQGATPDPVWTIREAFDGATELVLRNHGRAHLGVSRLTLREPGAALPLLSVDQGLFALPGDEHSWRLEKPIDVLPHMLEVRAETQRGELVMPLSHARE